jgi:large subunit ribosomal protein L32e
MRKKTKPNFTVPNSKKIKRVPSRWRKPRGIDNKQRIRQASEGAVPRVGYKNRPEVRGAHPCGVMEVIVHNPGQLAGLSGVVVRIAGAVGAKKREMIIAKAGELKLRVLNPGSKPKKAEEKEAKPAAKAQKEAKKEAEKPVAKAESKGEAE